MGLMLDGTPTYDWWVIDHHGHRWDLYGDIQGNDGITFSGITGAEASLTRTMTATARQIGQRVGSEHYDALEPTLTVSIDEREHPWSFTHWNRAWSQHEGRENKLYCQSPYDHRARHIIARRRAGREAPDADPHVAGVTIQSTDLLALGALWRGETVELGPGGEWTNDGDVEPLIRYLPPVGASGTVGLEVDGRAWSASHPSFPVDTEVDLDPEEMMKTYVGGEPVPAYWSTWRNHWNPLTIPAGATVRTTQPTGGRIIIIPRYETPW